MTSMQLFQGFSGVDAELLANVEQPPVRKRAPSGKRIWLIAAVVALAALLVGCAAYYVLSMKRVKIGESAEQRDYTLVDGVYEKDPHTVSTNILTPVWRAPMLTRPARITSRSRRNTTGIWSR